MTHAGSNGSHFVQMCGSHLYFDRMNGDDDCVVD